MAAATATIFLGQLFEGVNRARVDKFSPNQDVRLAKDWV